MKRVGAKLPVIARVLDMTERDTERILEEIEFTPFRKFYDVKNGYYYGNVIEAIKYYKIIKEVGNNGREKNVC